MFRCSYNSTEVTVRQPLLAWRRGCEERKEGLLACLLCWVSVSSVFCVVCWSTHCRQRWKSSSAWPLNAAHTTIGIVHPTPTCRGVFLSVRARFRASYDVIRLSVVNSMSWGQNQSQRQLEYCLNFAAHNFFQGKRFRARGGGGEACFAFNHCLRLSPVASCFVGW